MTFTVTGTATDDVGVNSIGMTIRDGSNRYLQADGTVSSTGHTFRITPDVVGARSTTWSKEITVPDGGHLEGAGPRHRHGGSVRPRHRATASGS